MRRGFCSSKVNLNTAISNCDLTGLTNFSEELDASLVKNQKRNFVRLVSNQVDDLKKKISPACTPRDQRRNLGGESSRTSARSEHAKSIGSRPGFCKEDVCGSRNTLKIPAVSVTKHFDVDTDDEECNLQLNTNRRKVRIAEGCPKDCSTVPSTSICQPCETSSDRQSECEGDGEKSGAERRYSPLKSRKKLFSTAITKAETSCSQKVGNCDFTPLSSSTPSNYRKRQSSSRGLLSNCFPEEQSSAVSNCALTENQRQQRSCKWLIILFVLILLLILAASAYYFLHRRDDSYRGCSPGGTVRYVPY